MEEIVARINEWMQKNKISAPELAKVINMNRSTVVHIMNGRNKPSLQFVIKLAEYDPNLDLRLLMTGVPSPTLSKNNHISKESLDARVVVRTKEVITHQQTMVVLHDDGTYKTFVEQL